MKQLRWSTSARLFARAEQVLPGGVNSPIRAFTAVGGDPLVIAGAKGATVTDVDGNTYLDYVMSGGALIHGHAARGLVRAVEGAARAGAQCGAPTEIEVRLAEKVRALMPSVERVRFVSSGTEAAMSAVRLARAATGRDRIIKFDGCYHGHADAFLVKAGSAAGTVCAPTSPGVPRKAVQHTLLAAYNDLSSCERLCDTHRHQIAAVIVEPLATNMGVVLPSDGFLAGAARPLRPAQDAAGVRRGDVGLPRGGGRRPAGLARHARPHVPRQYRRRRPSASGRMAAARI